MNDTTLVLLPPPEPDLIPVRNTIKKLYGEIQAHVEAALRKAIRIGGELVKLQKSLKHQKCYENWVNGKLPFSARSARDYVTLFRNRELIENESDADRLSIRAALKFIRDTAKAAEPPILNVCPEEIEVQVEEVQEEEAEDEALRQADREVLLVEANSGLIAELIGFISAAKHNGKDVTFQKIGAFDADVRLHQPFRDILARASQVRPPGTKLAKI